MANGAPVVALGTSAIPETIRDGGIVLPAGAGVLEFVETIAAVISDSELQSALRLKGYERVQADFEINASEKFVEILVRETL
jgi:glycosyltransferase involved in cell wall biosynthesis